MSTKLRHIFWIVLFVCPATLASAGTISIPLVTVGDPGNLADPDTGYGNVNYVYAIGEFDVTIAEYTAFLNAVATSDSGDPYHLYDSRMGNIVFGRGGCTFRGNGDMPAIWVTWADAARFVNWLSNGQPTGGEGAKTTETGTYTLNGAMTDAALMAVTRNPGSTWVLPNVNEWYKSAYYVGGGTNAGYWTYATQSNMVPSNVLSATGTNNANFIDSSNLGPPNYGYTDPTTGLTPVGTFADSPSAYGTYDQNGDVWQWNETPISGLYRDTRGGSFAGGWGSLYKWSDSAPYPMLADPTVGFRVAYVPEPSTLMLLIVATVTVFLFPQALTRKRIGER